MSRFCKFGKLHVTKGNVDKLLGMHNIKPRHDCLWQGPSGGIRYLPCPIILLDEPTYALDKDTASDIISTINSIKKEKFVLISTHDTGVKQISDKEIYIDRNSD